MEKVNFETNVIDINFNKRKPSKKHLILEAWTSGVRDIWALAEELQTQPSYVAATLQENGFIQGYYDLYTTPTSPLNIYTSETRGKMSFKDMKAAKYSTHVLEDIYHKFLDRHDRSGQHHCLVTALTMYNRARFSGKSDEAKVFKDWFLSKLTDR